MGETARTIAHVMSGRRMSGHPARLRIPCVLPSLSVLLAALSVLLAALILLELPANAQLAPERGQDGTARHVENLVGGKHEFALLGGGSFVSGPTWGRARDRTLVMAELRYSVRVAQWNAVAAKYVFNVVPLALLGDKQFITMGNATIEGGREYVYGGGVLPVGFQFNFRPRKKLQPFLDTNGGFLYFTRPVLSPRGSQLNFTIHYGGGVQVFTSARRAITLGYKYHHMSNAEIADNPGTDSNIFYLGWSFFR